MKGRTLFKLFFLIAFLRMIHANKERGALPSLIRDVRDIYGSSSLSLKFLYLSGAFLITCGIFHSFIFLSSKSSWEGPLSWRKPIIFAVSGGVTNLSVGWVVHLLSKSCSSSLSQLLESAFCVTFALCMSLEVFIITMQTWRRVPSHFNQKTEFDAKMFGLMGVLIGVVSLQIFLLNFLSFFLPANSFTRSAQYGISLLSLGCILGFVITSVAFSNLQKGESTTRYKRKGILKFPHGLPLHAVQFLPIQTWLMNYSAVPLQKGNLLLDLSALGFLLATIYGIVQTFSGKARFEASAFLMSIFILSIFLIFLPFFFSPFSQK